MGLSLMVEATMFSGKTVKILLILSGIGTIVSNIFTTK
jgi:predicted MFS family arabinose efflux permease